MAAREKTIPMAIDVKRLTRDWIQYLKNNQIVSMQSEPETGKLNYKRKVTTDDVAKFLEVKTDFDNQAITNAIHMVLAKKATGTAPKKVQNNPSAPKPGTSLSTWHHTEVKPGERKPQQTPQAVDIGPTRISHDKDSISDIDYKEVPDDDPKKKPRFKRRTNVNEAFVDEEGYTLSEEEIEEIFNILAAGQKSGESPAIVEPQQQPSNDERKIKDLNRLKNLIRDRMGNAERKALWRALRDA